LGHECSTFEKVYKKLIWCLFLSPNTPYYDKQNNRDDNKPDYAKGDQYYSLNQAQAGQMGNNKYRNPDNNYGDDSHQGNYQSHLGHSTLRCLTMTAAGAKAGSRKLLSVHAAFFIGT
jgi:hypothetical protein